METKKVKCKKCGYEWNTASKHVYVSCPSCMQKVKIRDIEKEAEEDAKDKNV